MKVFQGACLEQLSLISGVLLSSVAGRDIVSGGTYSAAALPSVISFRSTEEQGSKVRY